MATLALLDIEADAVDPFRHIEIEHLARHGEAFRRQHRDHMERHAALAKPPNPGDCLLEGTMTGAAPAIDVVQPFWAVDADPDIDVGFGEEGTPSAGPQQQYRQLDI